MGSTRKKKRIIGDSQRIDPLRLDGPNGFVALSVLTSPTQAKRPKAKDGPPCDHCTARCCKYFALPIDKPKTKADYGYVRWYLMHEGIAVWVDEGDWYLEVRTVCKHLLPDNRCGIYERAADLPRLRHSRGRSLRVLHRLSLLRPLFRQRRHLCRLGRGTTRKKASKEAEAQESGLNRCRRRNARSAGLALLQTCGLSNRPKPGTDQGIPERTYP